MPKKTASLSLLEKAAQQLAGEMGLEYVDTELVKEPGGRFLRIYIDQPGGITLEQLESYHRQIRSAAYEYLKKNAEMKESKKQEEAQKAVKVQKPAVKKAPKL